MTLGLDALATGVRIFPLSVAIILASAVGTRMANTKSPKKIIRAGQYLLVFGVLILLGSINIDLKGFYFGAGMFRAWFRPGPK